MPAELTEAQVADLKKKALVILSWVRQSLLTNQPFIGQIALNLRMVPTRDYRMTTMSTDGRNIFVDLDFLAGLSMEERKFCVAHEVWHNVMMHFARRGSRNHKVFNYATDMEINQLLRDDGFIAPPDLIWPNAKTHQSPWNFPDHLSAEDYYELLMKDYVTLDGLPGIPTSGKRLTGQFDGHIDPGDDPQIADEDGSNQDKWGKRMIDPDYRPVSKMTDSEKQQMQERMRENIIGAAQQIERTRGELPGYIKQLIKDLLTPKISWKQVLASFMTNSVINKTTWNRPNRRHICRDLYLPADEGESLKIAIGIDTSGSCANDFEKFMTEMNAITKQFNGYELHCIQCDTQVTDYRCFNETKPLDEAAIKGYEFKGLGGTILHPVFDYLKNHEDEIEVDAIVFFTDGECEEITEDMAPSVPVIWCITGASSKNLDETTKNLHFGRKLSLED